MEQPEIVRKIISQKGVITPSAWSKRLTERVKKVKVKKLFERRY